MKISYTLTPDPDSARREAGFTRLALHITVTLDDREKTFFKPTDFATTSTGCPVKLFQHGDENDVGCATMRTFTRFPNGVISRFGAFVKANLPTDSFTAGSRLRLPIPGISHYGYINASDEDAFNRWFDDQSTQIIEHLQSYRDAAASRATRSSATSRSKAAPALTAENPEPSEERVHVVTHHFTGRQLS